jgi:hypothetical protein
VLETRSDALDNSMPAFDYLRQDGRCFGVRGEGFVVAIGGNSCCGGTSEGDFGSKRAFCYWLNTLRHWVRRFLLGKAHGN